MAAQKPISNINKKRNKYTDEKNWVVKSLGSINKEGILISMAGKQ